MRRKTKGIMTNGRSFENIDNKSNVNNVRYISIGIKNLEGTN